MKNEYKITINRNSIRKNPHYQRKEQMKGAEQFYIVIEADMYDKILPTIGSCSGGYWSDRYGFRREYIIDRALDMKELYLLMKGIKEGFYEIVHTDYSCDMIEVTSIDTYNTKYLYTYNLVRIQCPECHSTFIYDKLKTETDSDENVIRKNICPVCNKSDCANLVFETMSENELAGWAEINGNKKKKEL
jgi:hypothetical protein